MFRTVSRNPAGTLLLIVAAEVFLFWLPLLLGMKPGKYSKDGNPIAVLSFLNLVTTGVLCWKVYRLREERGTPFDWRAPQTLWALMAAGFVFLGVDEVVRIHENLDLWIHRLVLRAEATNVTNRLDDLI